MTKMLNSENSSLESNEWHRMIRNRIDLAIAPTFGLEGGRGSEMKRTAKHAQMMIVTNLKQQIQITDHYHQCVIQRKPLSKTPHNTDKKRLIPRDCWFELKERQGSIEEEILR